jgi:hypothetical protein
MSDDDGSLYLSFLLDRLLGESLQLAGVLPFEADTLPVKFTNLDGMARWVEMKGGEVDRAVACYLAQELDVGLEQVGDAVYLILFIISPGGSKWGLGKCFTGKACP